MSSTYPPTINAVTSPANGFWQVVTGTKTANLYVFCRNNNSPWSEAQYDDGVIGLKWNMNFQLHSGDNVIQVVTRPVLGTTDNDSAIVSATIYLIVSTPEVHNVWNSFDELGLLLGLPRILGEKNSDYKTRLLDVYKNPANSTYDGLMNGISRELGLTEDQIEVVTLNELMDKSSEKNLFNVNGNAIGTKLTDYVDEVYDHNPVFWGNVVADESYWDSIDETTNGYAYLPHQWDPVASGIYEKWQTSGIGDNDDLWVTGPVEVWNEDIQANSWYMKVHSGYFYSTYPSGVFSQ